KVFSLQVFVLFSSRSRHTISKRDWSSDVCSSDLIITRQSIIVRIATVRSGSSLVWKRLSWSIRIPMRLCRASTLAGLPRQRGVRSEERRVGGEGGARREQGGETHDKWRARR